MTKARRRVVQLALMLRLASVEPVFAGCNYREMHAGLAQQLAGLTPSQRTTVRRQALRLISEAGGLANAADHLVPRPLQQERMGWEPPTQPPLEQMHRHPPDTPRCSVCRMRSGLRKRSFPSHAAAQQLCDRQKDPGLVVYARPVSQGFHLGHLPGARPATVGDPATTPQRPKSHRVDAVPKQFPMTMQATAGHPLLIFQYSFVLLLIGCAIGRYWIHTPTTALWLCVIGGLLTVVHDFATATLWFFLTARWVRSVMTKESNSSAH